VEVVFALMILVVVVLVVVFIVAKVAELLKDWGIYFVAFCLLAFFYVVANLLFPNLEINSRVGNFFSKDAKHLLGVVFSIVGLWFSGSSIIGKKRLEEIEKRVDQDNNYIANKITGVTSVVLWPFQYWKVLLISTMIVMFFFLLNTWTSQGLKLDFAIVLAVIGSAVVFGGVIFAVIYFPLAIILGSLGFGIGVIGKLMLLPYRFIGLLDKESKFERTLLFIGILLGTVGLLLLEL